jgi:hypothetical protein
MDDPAASLVSRVRDHFVAQFQAFVDEKERAGPTGASEVKIQLRGGELFRQLWCVDFIKKDDGQHQVVEFQPGKFLKFEPISGSYGAARLSIEQLRWENVLISHDLPSPPVDEIADWFQRWFDPDDERLDPSSLLGNVIHSLLIEPGILHVDFGTASSDAFWELLDVLEEAGAAKLRVHCSNPLEA